MIEALGRFFYWQGIPTLLGCELETDPTKADIALVGLPSTCNQIERTQSLAPRAIRHRSKTCHRSHRQFGVDPFALARVRDKCAAARECHSPEFSGQVPRYVPQISPLFPLHEHEYPRHPERVCHRRIGSRPKRVHPFLRGK
jgi:hypothetical protein